MREKYGWKSNILAKYYVELKKKKFAKFEQIWKWSLQIFPKAYHHSRI